MAEGHKEDYVNDVFGGWSVTTKTFRMPRHAYKK